MKSELADGAERRLTTILAGDIAEYSRLMRADEDGTLASLGACRAIVDGLIAAHRGRIANTAGDSILAEFPSVSDGLACALAAQEAISKQNEDVPADRRMLFRIGIHVGDVIAKNGDLFGDAVNVAARLQALAEPGGICVSAAVREHAGARTEAIFSDAGPQPVKNIADPVHVFRVGPASRHPAPAGGPGSAYEQASGIYGPARPLPLPDKPSVAVLPFTNMSTDAELEYFGDGVSEDIITALSRYPSLFVIARNSCFTYKGRAVDVKQVGRELGVRYVLEGSLRRAANRIRVTAQLIEAETGNHVWAERYDRDLADIFAVQDEITDAVTIAIAPAIGHAEQRRAIRKPPGSLDAWGAYQRGLWHLSAFTAADTERARDLFQQAIDLDANFVGGYYGLAAAWLQFSNTFMLGSLAEAVAAAETLARQAVAIDATDAEARACLGRVLTTMGDPEGGRTEIARALAISPNLAVAHNTLGTISVFAGSPRQGIISLERGLRLDPRDPRSGITVNQIVIAHYYCQDYEQAVAAARRVISAYPEHPLVHRWLAAALGQLGRSAEARAALDVALTRNPASFDVYVRRRVPWHRPEDHAHMVEGLRKAGWEG
jgi:adenylate cyclase